MVDEHDAPEPEVKERLRRVERALLEVKTNLAPLVAELRWESVDAAAERLGVHPATLRRAARRGEIKSRRIGRRLLVAAEDRDEAGS